MNCGSICAHSPTLLLTKGTKESWFGTAIIYNEHLILAAVDFQDWVPILFILSLSTLRLPLNMVRAQLPCYCQKQLQLYQILNSVLVMTNVHINSDVTYYI